MQSPYKYLHRDEMRIFSPKKQTFFFLEYTCKEAVGFVNKAHVVHFLEVKSIYWTPNCVLSLRLSVAGAETGTEISRH